MSDEQTWRQQLKGVRAFVETLKEPEAEQRDTATIAGKFAEALGCLENALYWLGQINEQYDPEQHSEGIHLHRRSRLYNMDFWLQAELAEDAVKSILGKLQRVEPLAPKEKEGTK